VGISVFSPSWLVNRIHARAVRAAVDAHGRGRILDVGCGRQPFRALLESRATALAAVESDPARYAAGPRPQAWASGLELPFHSDCFDAVVAFQVLEHVPEPGRMMGEMARVLAPGGRLIVTAPHIWGIHEEPADYYRFTGYGLTHLARSAGLEVLEVQALAGYWVTAGARFCYYLQHFDRWGFGLLVRPLYAAVHLVALALDGLHRVESDTWNFLLVAAKPAPGSAQAPGLDQAPGSDQAS